MVDEISTDELKEKLDADDDDDVQVIDIREEHEVWNVDGFVPGAKHIPMSRLTMELGNHDWGDEI
ncbi:MAG: rhodanese-like domain-containing protein, partial [Halobacteria archaeon]|nr:rhodanese-like domain-containing protein [Halobacteria archaeon]